MMVGYKQPPSIEKSRRVIAAFEAKVAILEKWASLGVPTDILARARPDGTLSAEDLPRDHAKLRRWQGPGRDLATWSDPLIDRPVTGKHPELSERFRVAVANIDKWCAKKTHSISFLETEKDLLRAENQSLRLQNMNLLGEIQQAKDELAFFRAKESLPRR